jgi:hypothetical protein
MRLLLDENLPKDLAGALTGHEVASVVGLGWAGTRNGELLRRSGAAGYFAIITMDSNMPFQQDPAKLPLAIVVLKARSNAMRHLGPMGPAILDAVRVLEPRTIVVVRGE